MSVDHIAASLIQNAAASEGERIRRIDRAWQHFLGTAEKQLPLSADGTDDNVRINLSEALVSKGVSWLLGADRALGFTVTDADENPDEEAVTVLNRRWPVHKRALTLNQLATNGGVTGQAFGRLILPEGDEGEFRVVVWDPSAVDVTWDDDDYEDVIEYCHTWIVPVSTDDLTPTVRRERITRNDAGTAWDIVIEESKASGGSWVVVEEDVHPYPWAPVFACQNLPMPNEYWGRADLEMDVMDLIDAIEAVAGYGRKLIRHQGHQTPWVTGESAKNIAKLSTALGQLLAIPDANAKVGQLQAGDPDAASWLYEKLVEAFHLVTRTPPIAFGLISIANIAEDTIENLYAPAVEKTWDKRLTYGPMFIDLTRRMLEVAGRADLVTAPVWPQIIPRSEASQAATYETDLRMGVASKETISEKRGYDWETESERISEERKQAAADFNAGIGDDPNLDNPTPGGPNDPAADPQEED